MTQSTDKDEPVPWEPPTWDEFISKVQETVNALGEAESEDQRRKIGESALPHLRGLLNKVKIEEGTHICADQPRYLN